MKLQFLFLSLIIHLHICAQHADTLIGRIFYHTYYTKDSSNPVKEYEDFMLDVGVDFTKYHSYLFFKIDSVLHAAAKNPAGMNREEVKKWAMTSCSSYRFYHNVKTDSIYTRTDIAGDFMEFPEEIKYNWQIQNDTDTLLGFACQKAITNWRGRTYIAWFSSDIPLPYGPMKFFGLPGLILRLQDDKNYFGYEAYALNLSLKEPTEQFKEHYKYIKTTRAKYLQLFDLEEKDPLNYLRTVKGYNFTIKGGDESVPKRKPVLKMELE